VADYFPEITESTLPVRGRDPELVTRVEERLGELIATGFEITKIDAVTRQAR
jgi:hypothetical protein